MKVYLVWGCFDHWTVDSWGNSTGTDTSEALKGIYTSKKAAEQAIPKEENFSYGKRYYRLEERDLLS